MSVLTFQVEDRPLLGVLLQEPSVSPQELKTPDELADYFEQRVQPGTVEG